MSCPTLAGLIVTITIAQTVNAQAPAPKPARSAPALVNTCLITQNVEQLTNFYSQVLRIPPQRPGSEYSEFRSGVGVLAIFSAKAQEQYIPKSVEPANNKSAILQFEVLNVDEEYARLQPIVKAWVKRPTTQPWGTRSIYFRDPDGNLIDFYTWVKKPR